MTNEARAFRKPHRWAVLAAFSAVAGVSQMLWLNFAPLLSLVQQRYGVSELMASMFVLVFPLLYVVFSIPAGALTDAAAIASRVGLGAVLMAAFSCLRLCDRASGSCSPARWASPSRSRTSSTASPSWWRTGSARSRAPSPPGSGTMGMFLGMARGHGRHPGAGGRLQPAHRPWPSSPASPRGGGGLPRDRAAQPGRAPASRARRPAWPGSATLLGNRPLLILFALAFLGLGVFNGLTTWLEQILAPHGIDAVQAGFIGGALILGGIVGAVVIPALSDAGASGASRSCSCARRRRWRRSTRCAPAGATPCCWRWGRCTASSSCPPSR